MRNVALLGTRLVVGSYLAVHGAQKLFGAFGGPGLEKAGVAPAVKLVAVNGRQFTTTVLRDAVAQTASDAKPLELLLKNGEYFETRKVDYRGGEKYPHLQHVKDKTDVLTDIFRDRVPKKTD